MVLMWVGRGGRVATLTCYWCQSVVPENATVHVPQIVTHTFIDVDSLFQDRYGDHDSVLQYDS